MQASYRRSQGVRERRRLEVLEVGSAAALGPAQPPGRVAGPGALASSGGVRQPRMYREVGGGNDATLPPIALAEVRCKNLNGFS